MPKACHPRKVSCEYIEVFFQLDFGTNRSLSLISPEKINITPTKIREKCARNFMIDKKGILVY
jgi:hypothetical protein